MDTFTDRFETLMDDKRVRAVGIAIAAVLLAISMGLLMASKSPPRPINVGKVLPDAPLNVPIYKYLPYPDMRVFELRAMAPAMTAKVPGGAVVQARGKTMLSRR
ncbi:MAG: hypothetical protein Q8N26_11120 [Myxococcales bacterium]|nr:hypothetical protein [Myxococcales bacterium]